MIMKIKEEDKDLNYWKNNCEEDYLHTPISVLRYITKLEEKVNDGVLDNVSNSLPDHVVKFRLQELEMKYDYLMEQFNKMNDC